MTKLQTKQGEKIKIGIFAYHQSCTFYHSPRSSDIASKILVSVVDDHGKLFGTRFLSILGFKLWNLRFTGLSKIHLKMD